MLVCDTCLTSRPRSDSDLPKLSHFSSIFILVRRLCLSRAVLFLLVIIYFLLLLFLKVVSCRCHPKYRYRMPSTGAETCVAPTLFSFLLLSYLLLLSFFSILFFSFTRVDDNVNHLVPFCSYGGYGMTKCLSASLVLFVAFDLLLRHSSLLGASSSASTRQTQHARMHLSRYRTTS